MPDSSHATADSSFAVLGFDPAPGSPAAVGTLADDIHGTYSKLKAADDVLSGIINGTGGWTGVAADAFTAKIKELPKLLDSATSSFHRASTALTSWQEQLRLMQWRARQYEDRAEAADRRKRSAESDPDLQLAGHTFSSQAEADDAQRRLDNAVDRLDSARRDLEAIIADAEKLRAEHDECAERMAERVQRACEQAPDEPGLWDRLMDGLESLAEGQARLANAVWDWVKDHANSIAAIGDVLSALSLVTGLVGLACDATGVGALVGGPLGIASSALAAGALVTHGAAKAAGADVPNRSLAQDAMGAATLGIGGAAAKGVGIVQRVGKALKPAGEAAGGAGTVDSVASTLEDFSAFKHFLPQNERQAGQMILAPATGGISALAIPFENAWNAGSEKDRAAQQQKGD